MIVIALVAMREGRQIDRLLLDANDTDGATWYTGLVTYVGVLGWAAAVCAAWWAAWWCRLGGRLGASRFLGWGGLLGAYLMADDLLQLHAVLLPELGVPKHAVELAIIVATIVWVSACWRELARTRWPLLVAAGAALGASILLDAHPLTAGVGGLLFEDGAKLLGIFAWAAYFVATAADISRSVLQEAAASAPGRELRADDVERGTGAEPLDVLGAHRLVGQEGGR